MRVALPPPPVPHPSTAWGAEVAARRLIENFREHCSDIEFQTLMAGVESAEPSRRATAQPTLGTVSGSFAAGAVSPGWDLVHDVLARDPRRYSYLRSVGQMCFPFVVTHHALCHPTVLEDFFVPLLLARGQPYDAVVCTSRPARAAVVNLLEICREGLASVYGGRAPTFEGQLPVIPLGVDTRLFRPRDKDDVRRQLRVPADACVILWVGRFSPWSKADLLPLVRAYGLLRQRNPDANTLLVLVGTDAEGYGGVLERCAALLGLESCVRIERTMPQVPVHLWYSASDIFVSPIDNAQETFGIAPVEAMASGLPQVVSDWDGHRDTVVHGDTGFRVRTFWAACDEDAVASWAVWGNGEGSMLLVARTVAYDLGEMVGYLEQLLRSVDLRNKMGVASRARAVAEFAWPVIVGRYVELWNELAACSRRFRPPAPRPGLIMPAFFRAFAGYASHVLAGDSRVRINPDAGEGLSEEPSLSIEVHPAVERGAQGIHRVLSGLADQGGELTVDALTAAMASEGYSVTEVRRLVLRGLKYGLLQVA
jgi:D-inositol-3-phosphate glycosyltransferase